MKNKLLFRRIGYKLFIFFIVSFCFVPKGYSMDEETSFWQRYQKWFEYKKTQSLDGQQRQIILYFEKANSIFEQADNTWGASIKRTEPAPKEALQIVSKCRNDLSRLKPPSIVKKHYNATLKLLDIIQTYHLKRRSTPNSKKLGELVGNAIPYESIQSSEYFRIMKEAGLFENIEEEMNKISDNSGEGNL